MIKLELKKRKTNNKLEKTILILHAGNTVQTTGAKYQIGRRDTGFVVFQAQSFLFAVISIFIIIVVIILSIAFGQIITMHINP